MINGDLCHELLLEKTKQKLAFDEKADQWKLRKKISEFIREHWKTKSWLKNLRICLETNNLLGLNQNNY